MKCIYIAGPYSANTKDLRDANIKAANDLAMIFAEGGWAVYCPHTQSRDWENLTDMEYEQFLQADFEWISRCDAIAMLCGWAVSEGAVREYVFAKARFMPIYHEEEDEWECPIGLDFRADVMRYKREEGQVIIRKQRDYGPGNIKAFGDFGVLVRANDKFERLKNLYKNEGEPQNEPIDDSWMDESNYGTIARMYRNGDWPDG